MMRRFLSAASATLVCAASIAVAGAPRVIAQSTAIQGRVSSASGDPVEGATVRVSLVRFHEGRRRAVDVGLPATTDDHGRYHIDGLAAGRYLVTLFVTNRRSTAESRSRRRFLAASRVEKSSWAGHDDLDLTTTLLQSRASPVAY
jgi:hypothetical protein